MKAGERSKRAIYADGPRPTTANSPGRNVLIGFMTWEGYNYEDAVLISERLVKDDVYTSIHTRNTNAKPATPNSVPKRSPAKSRTSAMTP